MHLVEDFAANELCEFAPERDWDQFHPYKNPARAFSVEAAELPEQFQRGADSQPLAADQLERSRMKLPMSCSI